MRQNVINFNTNLWVFSGIHYYCIKNTYFISVCFYYRALFFLRTEWQRAGYANYFVIFENGNESKYGMMAHNLTMLFGERFGSGLFKFRE